MSVSGNKSLVQPNQWIDSLELPLEDTYGEYLRNLINQTTECPVRLESYLLLYTHLPKELRPRCPLRLQDRHISPKLALRRVIHCPSLLRDLQQSFCSQLSNFIYKNGAPLSAHSYLTVQRRLSIVSNADGLIFPYMKRIGLGAIRYAAKLNGNPNINNMPLKIQHSPYSVHEYFLSEYAIRPGADSPSKLRVIQNLEGPNRHRSALCTFSFYPPTQDGEDAVHASLVHQFTPTFASADPYILPCSNHDEQGPTDWEDAFWSAYVPKPCFDISPTVHSRSAPQRTRMWIPGRTEQPPSEYKPHPPHFVQRAWNTAVENDATFIVFSSGNTERIGIRHRATSTLFLSDVMKINDESYYLTQMALFSFMVQDGMNSTRPSTVSQGANGDEHDLGPEANHETPQRPLKQPKVTHTRVLPPEFDKEMARRSVVLLTFNVGVHRSQMSSGFLRKKPACTLGSSDLRPAAGPKAGQTYPIWDCINIEIGEVLGSGHECRVYRGTAKMRSKSDPNIFIEGSVILKVPHARYLARGVLNEYNVYSKLASEGIREGIIKMHGLFEDPETGHVMLLMQDVGRVTLEDRERKKIDHEKSTSGKNIPQKISETEFKILRRIIESINGAGILHNDVKPDNIMLGDDGLPYIIDFGISQFTTEFYLDSGGEDPPWSQIDPHALALVEEDMSTGIRSFDRQTIEDLFIGRYDFDRRYSYRAPLPHLGVF